MYGCVYMCVSNYMFIVCVYVRLVDVCMGVSTVYICMCNGVGILYCTINYNIIFALFKLN